MLDGLYSIINIFSCGGIALLSFYLIKYERNCRTFLLLCSIHFFIILMRNVLVHLIIINPIIWNRVHITSSAIWVLGTVIESRYLIVKSCNTYFKKFQIKT